MWAVPNVAFSDLRKLKRWRPRELEEDLHITTLVDVHDTRLALADFDGGHGMNDLRYVLLRLAFPASIVTQCRDGEFSRLLCYPAEGGRGGSRFPFPPLEPVENVIPRLSGARV